MDISTPLTATSVDASEALGVPSGNRISNLLQELDSLFSFAPATGDGASSGDTSKISTTVPSVKLPQWCERKTSASETITTAVAPRHKPQFDFPMHQTINHVIPKITRLAKIYKDNPDLYELESRLIVKVPTSHEIDTNITEPLYQQILDFYRRNYPLWPDWKMTRSYNTHDQYYPGDIRERTTWRKLESGAIEPVMISGKLIPLTPQWVQKELVENSDWYVSDRPLAIRFSLKTERPIDPPTAPGALGTLGALGAPGRCVTKSTTLFEDAFTVTSFSEVWTGDSANKAAVSKPTFTIEVENKNTLALYKIDPFRIAKNLIIRTVELQGTDTPCSLSEV